jgi:signal transduction histidine kinase
MLEREPVDLAELREICDDIVTEDLRAAEIIRGLQKLYRRGELKLEPLDVNAVVRETLDFLWNEMLTRHVTTVTDLTSAPPPIHADRVQMQQVLLNLILNATDAMSGNAGGDRIVTIRTELAGAEVRLSVVDRGPGIAAGDLKNVFDAFWSTRAGGMGMGLAIARSIVVAHGGSIAVVNNSAGGATFCVTLPVREEA